MEPKFQAYFLVLCRYPHFHIPTYDYRDLEKVKAFRKRSMSFRYNLLTTIVRWEISTLKEQVYNTPPPIYTTGFHDTSDQSDGNELMVWFYRYQLYVLGAEKYFEVEPHFLKHQSHPCITPLFKTDFRDLCMLHSNGQAEEFATFANDISHRIDSAIELYKEYRTDILKTELQYDNPHSIFASHIDTYLGYRDDNNRTNSSSCIGNINLNHIINFSLPIGFVTFRLGGRPSSWTCD